MNHRHVLVNDKLASIPSMRLKIGDEVTLKPASQRLPMVLETIKDMPLTRPEWLGWDEQAMKARVTHLPAPDDVPFPVDVQQVVEYYANRL